MEAVAEAVEKEAAVEVAAREAVLVRAEVAAGARLVEAPLAVTGLVQQATHPGVAEVMHRHQSRFTTLRQ